MALRYWVGGTANWDATAGTKWALTSGGAGGQAVPTSADDVFFDVASGAVTVTLASPGATVGTINFTGFTGTFIFAANLSSGNTTLGASTTYTASGGNPTTYTFTPRNVNSTFTANGKILPTNLFTNLSGGNTLTFAGNADFGGNITTAATAHNIKSTTGFSYDLRIGGNISLNAITTSLVDPVTIKGYGASKTYATGNATTNAKISFVALSSYTSSATSGLAGTSSLTVEVGGNFTVPNSAHRFTNTGTVTLSGFNSSNNSYFFGLLASGSGTIVLSNDTVIKSSITIATLGTTISSTAGAKLLLEGDFLSTNFGNYIIDILEFSGTTASNVTAVTNIGNLQIKQLIINKTGAGSVNFNSAGYFTLFIPALNTYSWTHTAGTVTQGSNCTIRIWLNTVATSIFNYSAPSPSMFTFRDIEFYGAGVTNLNTKLNATKISITPTGTMSISSSGLFGFDTESLFVVNTTTGGRVVTLKSGVTYNITALLIMVNTGGSFLTLNASTSPTKAKFYLGLSAIQEVSNVNPTDIDSHGANNIGPPIFQTIYSQNGVITASTWNWSIGNAPPPIAAKVTVGYTFVN